MRNIKTVIYTAAVLIVLMLLSGCEEGLRIVKREIGSLPEKLTYVQYIDKEIDFTGGTVLYHAKQGTVSEVDMLSAVIDEAVDFNTPGDYTVTIDSFDDNAPQFTVTVIRIDDADWLDEETKEEAKRIASFDTSEDQEKIKQVLDKYFNDYNKEYIAEIISSIEQNKDHYRDFDDLINTYKCLTCNPNNVYRHFEITGNTAIVRMTEHTNWYDGDKVYRLSYSRRTITLLKENGQWKITTDKPSTVRDFLCFGAKFLYDSPSSIEGRTVPVYELSIV